MKLIFIFLAFINCSNSHAQNSLPLEQLTQQIDQQSTSPQIDMTDTSGQAPVVYHPFEYEIVNELSKVVNEIDQSPTKLCSLINSSLNQILLEQTRWKNESVFNIREMLFELKKRLINAQNDKTNDCKDNYESLFYRILEVEKVIIYDRRFAILQHSPRTLLKPFELEFQKFELSKYLNGNVKDLETGDIILTSNLRFQYDFSRAVADSDILYSHSAIIYKDSQKNLWVISAEGGAEGIAIKEFNQYIKNNYYTFLFLRPKNQTIAKRAGDFAYKYFSNIPPKKRFYMFDNAFDTHEHTNFYCAELIYFAFNSVSPNYFTKEIESFLEFYSKSILVKYFNKPNLSVIFPKNMLFSGKFDLKAEWTYFTGHRINHISLQSAIAFLNLNISSLKINLDWKYKLLNTLWKFRDNSLIEKVLLLLGIPRDQLGYSKFSLTYFGKERYPILKKCIQKVFTRDIEYVYKEQKGQKWLSDKELQSLFTSCYLEELEKI